MSRSRWRSRLRALPLHRRLALISAVAVALGVAAASGFAYVATARALHAEVDRGLLATPVAGPVGPTGTDGPPGGAAGLDAAPPDVVSPERLEALCQQTQLPVGLQPLVGSMQLVRADGTTCAPAGVALVAVEASDVEAARTGASGSLRDDVTAAGDPVRVRTVEVTDGYAVMLTRDLGEVDRTLRSLAVALLLASGIGVLLATTAGLLVARAGLRPVDELTRATEHIADTQDLAVPIEVVGDDEVARLARSFNRMTAALAAARDRQQQLVADASHELRTPLTSLRTNIELLVRSDARGRPLTAQDRRELLGSVSAQLAELGQLVGELTVLAHDEPAPAPTDVRLDEVVRRAVARAGRRGDRDLRIAVQPWVVRGDPAGLERAVLNVLDNAVKFSDPGSRIDVALDEGRLVVTDAGAGLRPDEAQRVFDRFWRSPAARARPGSGLGLAIVADVVHRHGGSVAAAPGPAGGTRVTIALPGRAPDVETVAPARDERRTPAG